MQTSSKNRLARLEAAIRQRTKNRSLDVRRKQYVGADWSTIFNAIWDAADDEGRELLEEIVKQAKDYAAQPPRNTPGGPVPYTHGFLRWLDLLAAGYADLPDRVPTCVLRAWRNGYTGVRHPGTAWTRPAWAPSATWRCEDCRMVLPNAREDGSMPHISPCPICRSDKLAHLDCSQPFGTSWINPKTGDYHAG
jgi:hypothetical protein